MQEDMEKTSILNFRRLQILLPAHKHNATMKQWSEWRSLVEGELLVELKTVERFLPIHDAQVLTYLKHMRLRQGLLINFNVKRLVDGVRSILNSTVAGPELRP